jgi:hypothetical protein
MVAGSWFETALTRLLTMRDQRMAATHHFCLAERPEPG